MSKNNVDQSREWRDIVECEYKDFYHLKIVFIAIKGVQLKDIRISSTLNMCNSEFAIIFF